MKTFKVILKPLEECLHEYDVDIRSDNYWKVSVKYDCNRKIHYKPYIGFRTFYKKYFGSGIPVNVCTHKKYDNILQMYSDKGMHMMDIFKNWAEYTNEKSPELFPPEEEEKEIPVILTNLLNSWDDLVNSID